MLIRNFGQKNIFGQQNFGKKKSWSKKFGWKNFLVQKHFSPNFFWPIKFKVQKSFCTKNVWFNKIGCKKFWPKIILDLKKFGSKLILGLKKIGSKKIFGQEKFGQNWFSNIWDFADMDKCRQVKWCLNKFHHDTWHLLKMVPESWLWSLVKIGSVTA